ncbi:MAG: serine/threonine-protein kinase [Acidobacteriota bacterium]
MANDPPGCPRCGTAVPPEARFCPSCGASTSRLSPGQVLDGKYEILEKTGEGGMGEVYTARHVHLDEIRIIKVTKPDALGEGSEPRRFQEEARIASLIRHPNVAALYDFSRLPDGSFYMVWEFIDGVTLEEWLRRYGPMPAPRVLEVAAQVLSGLEEIHAQGIVHRDLAPDNIMLRENRDGKLLAKIIDLGIAKRVAAETLRMTGTGMFVGKLKYCSPEQAGSLPPGQAVDGRSDLYSFGIVLYEMLTGRPPFESSTPEGYLGKHLHASPPPLDTSRLPAEIAPALAAVVTRALEKQRDRRFRDAREFAAALAALTPRSTGRADLDPTVVVRQGGGGIGWLIGSAIALAIAAAAFAFVLYRPGPDARSTSSPTPAPVLSPRPTTPPSSSDEIVVQPRILEDATPVPPPAPTASPRRGVPTVSVPPTPPPAPRPTPAADQDQSASLELPGVGELNETRMRRMLEDWNGRPAERRAYQAVRLAYVANQWVKANPGDGLSAEIRRTLPRTLREDSDTLWNGSRPKLAVEVARAYLQLSFAPRDTEIERRVYEVPSRPQGLRRKRLQEE